MALKIKFDMPTNREGMNTLAQQAASRFKKMDALKNGHDVKERRLNEKYDLLLENVPQVGRKAALAALEEAAKQELASIARETEEQRRDILDELIELNRIAKETAPHLADTRIAASMHGLGTEERARYNAELVDAGPAVVREAAMRAKITGDRTLAAACWKRSQDLPKNLRPLGDSFVNEMFGPLTAGILEDAKVIDLNLEKALAVERYIRGENLPATKKIALGMKFPEERISVNDVDEDGSVIPVKTSTQMIRDGLKEL